MIIKTIFHICASICAIIAVASTLTSSQNKLRYFILFSVFAVVFEVIILNIKPSESIPSIDLQTSKVKYKEKLSDGQDNFDIVFNVVNSGNQDIVMLKYIVFSDSQNKNGPTGVISVQRLMRANLWILHEIAWQHGVRQFPFYFS